MASNSFATTNRTYLVHRDGKRVRVSLGGRSAFLAFAPIANVHLLEQREYRVAIRRRPVECPHAPRCCGALPHLPCRILSSRSSHAHHLVRASNQSAFCDNSVPYNRLSMGKKNYVAFAVVRIRARWRPLVFRPLAGVRCDRCSKWH
jgi:hypothetical protein